MNDIKPLTPFRFWAQKVIPLVYDESLSYYELLCKVIDYLNTMGVDFNELLENFNEFDADITQKFNDLSGEFDDLKEWAEREFPEFVNDKLDEMAEDGTLTRMIAPYLPSITPEMFGAVGDGITDDTAAVQEAIDTARTTGQTVYFNGKTYLCNILIYPFTKLCGSSKTILKAVPGSDQSVIKSYDFDEMTGSTGAAADDDGVYMVFLTDLIIDGNRENNEAGYGIEVWGRNLFFKNIFVRNCTSGGIYTEFSTHGTPEASESSFYSDMLESVFDTIKVYDCFGNGWTYKGPHDSHVYNYICVKCKEYALEASGYSNGLIVDHMNSWFTKHGVLLTGGSKLLNSQIDSAGYDGTDFTGTGVAFASGNANIQIDNSTIRNFATGLDISGQYHQISALLQTNIVTVKMTNLNSCTLDLIIAIASGADKHVFDLSQGSNNIVNAYIHGYDNNTLFGSGVPSASPNGKWTLRGDKAQFYYNIETTGTPNYYKGGYRFYDQIDVAPQSWTPLNATANTPNKYRINGYEIRFDVDLSLTDALPSGSVTLFEGVKALIPFSNLTYSCRGFAAIDGWGYVVQLTYDATTDTIKLYNVGSHNILANATVKGSISINIGVQ